MTLGEDEVQIIDGTDQGEVGMWDVERSYTSFRRTSRPLRVAFLGL